MKKQVISKRMRNVAAMFIVFAGLVYPASGAKVMSQKDQVQKQASLKGYSTVESMVDDLVGHVKFQFQPAPLNGQVNGVHGFSVYENTMEFPLWLMMNMNGPLFVDQDYFHINEKKKEIQDGKPVWFVNASFIDKVNGMFMVQFVIDAESGKTMVNVLPGEVDKNEDQNLITKYLYTGYIYPEELSYSYKNTKQEERALKSEQLIDSIVPRLNFKVNGFSVHPKWLERAYMELICCEKANEKWYVRLALPAEKNFDGRGGMAKMNKMTVYDFVIDSKNAKGFRRAGYYDYLPKNWQRGAPHNVAPN